MVSKGFCHLRGRKEVYFKTLIQYPKDIAPPAPAPSPSAPLPLKLPLSFSLVLVLSSARLAAAGGGGPAACYRHNPSSPSFSLHSRFNLPRLHLSLPTANEVFSPWTKKEASGREGTGARVQVGPLGQIFKDGRKMNALLCVSAL